MIVLSFNMTSNEILLSYIKSFNNPSEPKPVITFHCTLDILISPFVVHFLFYDI